MAQQRTAGRRQFQNLRWLRSTLVQSGDDGVFPQPVAFQSRLVGSVRRVVWERRQPYEGEFAFAHRQAWECVLHRGCHELSEECRPGGSERGRNTGLEEIGETALVRGVK